MKNFIDLLRGYNPNLGIRTQTRGANTAVTGITFSDDHKTLYITAAAPLDPAFTKDGYFQLKGVNGISGINRRYRILSVAPGTIITYPIIGAPLTGIAAPGGFILPITVGFQAFTFGRVQKGVKRDTGRPFDVLHGRARVKRS
jgi:hypothetical protein